MDSLREFILDRVGPKDYYSAIFPDAKWRGDRDTDVFCPFHEDERPGGTASLSLNPQTGAFFCHSCEAKGTTIVSFQAQYSDATSKEALTEVYNQHIRPIITERVSRRLRRALRDTPTALRFLRKKRMLQPETMKRFELGFDGARISIPIRNQFGLLINIRLYDPLASGKTGGRKMLNYKRDGEERSFGSPPVLFPFSALASKGSQVLICEGEWDAILLNQLGMPTITGTSGASSWPSEYSRMLAGRDVVLVFDNDEAGTSGAELVTAALRDIATSIRVLPIPKRVGKDVTDWVRNDQHMRSKKAWVQAIAKLKPIVTSELVGSPEDGALVEVGLSEASDSKYYGRPIRVKAMVTGKDVAPYILPREFRVTCNKAELCDGCPLESSTGSTMFRLSPQDPRVLQLVDAPEGQVNRILLRLVGIPKSRCIAKVEVIETFNLEQLIMIPTLDSGATHYVMRSAYLVGHGTLPNRSYRFEGVTVPHPRDQHATHLFSGIQPVQDDVGTFRMNPALRNKLRKFQPRTKSLLSHFMRLADWQSRNITRIKERPDMHTSVDLCFHSVASFMFNNETVDRGMLDVLVIGDTRCGKGYVSERLSKWYGLGEMASGENCSFAGLVGGLQQVSRRWIVTWGIIPINNGRLVIIDEASSMGEAEIGHMSRIRSEGVAEISKILREQTPANTRLIWLSNPRSGRPIMTYNAGVEAVKELMGNNEDISRFDFAMTVASNEVPSEIINAPDTSDRSDLSLYPRELGRKLVLWAWSRQPDQVIFSKGATNLIIAKSIEFGQQYSATIPLVQAENIRIKLAKVSAAVAARVFSTDRTGIKLLVKSTHVKFTCEFLNTLYSKSSMSYDVFSQSAKAAASIASPKRLERVFRTLGSDREACTTGLLELHNITPDNLADYAGDVVGAKGLIGDLVKARCLSRAEETFGYVKAPPFTEWLKQQKGADKWSEGVRSSRKSEPASQPSSRRQGRRSRRKRSRDSST